MNFLQDQQFLRKINKHKIREYVAKINLLDFETERPLAVLSGKVVSGNFSVSASSSVRRTGNLTLLADGDTRNITDLNNLVAINKKISLSIGFANPFYNDDQYAKYGSYLYFPQGVFFITSASSSFSTSGASVSLSLIDKMGGLNGTCGGTLLASTSFHDRTEIDKDGNEIKSYPLIKDIIKESVHHFGGEHYSKIVVEDVDDVGRIQVNYNGDTPIRISKSYYTNYAPDADPDNLVQHPGRSFIISEDENSDFPNTYYRGDPIGYMETPLTYPGELTMNSGQTVEAVLNEIAKTLGNFEYFYDVNGNFHFQRIKDFQMTGLAPLNWSDTYDKDLWGSYLPRYGNGQYIREFADGELVTQISYSPKYDNIKNDFVVWGTGNNTKNNTNTNNAVRYHLTIDRRPVDTPEALCHQQIYSIVDDETALILRYQTNDSVNEGETANVADKPLNSTNYPGLKQNFTFDWREELYRQALIAYGSSTRGSYYDEELMAEWRDIFDPASGEFKREWENHYGTGTWTGYNPNVQLAPNKIRYWLDIIDTSSALGGFSIEKIGHRTKVSENNKIRSVFSTEVPDIVFSINEGADDVETKTTYYNSIGQDYAFINPDQEELFRKVSSYGTCYEDIRALLMTNLIYNSAVNLTTIPIFYLDVNQLIRLNFPDLGIVGDYVIKNISWSLGNSNTMSLTLNEANIIV